MPFCSKCGTELVEGTKYCTKCGMAVGSNAVNPERGPIRRAKRKPISRIALKILDKTIIRFLDQRSTKTPAIVPKIIAESPKESMGKLMARLFFVK